jgi:hypothetical protein
MNEGNTLWAEHLERFRRIYEASPSSARIRTTDSAAIGCSDADRALHSEWTARPPGRLGRPLLGEIEPYLDFFATARS